MQKPFSGFRSPLVGIDRQRKVWAVAAAFVLALGLAACSVVRTVYNQADNLAYWQLNRAFRLDDAQADQVKNDLHAFFRWHRQEELPAYVRLLERAAREAQGPISPDLACERRAEFELVGRRSIDHAVPMLATLLRSLKPYQIKHLEDFMDDYNDDFRDDFLQADKAERDEAAGKFAVKWTEFFYGRFSKAQREKLVQGVLGAPMTPQDVYDEMLRIQKEFLQITRHAVFDKATQAQTEQALRTMILQTFEPPTEPRKSKLPKWIRAGCELGSATHAGTTPEQRNKVSELFTDWASDLRILSTQH